MMHMCLLCVVRGNTKSPLEISQMFPSIWGERISRFTEPFDSSRVTQYKSGSEVKGIKKSTEIS